MRAFHGDPAIRDAALARIKASGYCVGKVRLSSGWQRDGTIRYAGALEVTTGEPSPVAYETMLGIPFSLAQFEDGIDKTCSEPIRLQLPEDFIRAIPVGADLSKVAPSLKAWILGNPAFGLTALTVDEDVRRVVFRVISLVEHEKLYGVAREIDFLDVGAAQAICLRKFPDALRDPAAKPLAVAAWLAHSNPGQALHHLKQHVSQDDSSLCDGIDAIDMVRDNLMELLKSAPVTPEDPHVQASSSGANGGPGSFSEDADFDRH